MGRTCISLSKHTEKLHKVTPFGVSLSSKYLLAHSSLPTACGNSSHPIFATKCILHWPRVKMCTRHGLCTNPRAWTSLLNFLATAIPHLSRSLGVGAKLEASSLASRPVGSLAKAGPSFVQVLFCWPDGCPPPSPQLRKPMCGSQKWAGPLGCYERAHLSLV